MNQASKAPASQARYVMIGGFLGAGKTTCMLRLAERLRAEGKRVGLITNDQASELVDTAVLRSHGFSTAEIAGGCFCCRFDSLTEAARALTAESRPEVFLAEPVGSCTDLVATVSYPLRRIYGDRFDVAPLSVVVDPIRAERVLGLGEEGRQFSEKVLYIYRKQLEEADLIVINKRELLDEARLERLVRVLGEAFPRARVLAVSARERQGLDAWFEIVLGESGNEGRALSIDYDTYADGEALLGWLNATIDVEACEAGRTFDGNQLLKRLAEAVQKNLSRHGVEIAHCKMTFSPRDGLGELGVVNLVRSDFVPELGQALPEPVEGGEVIFNLRAEGDPELLRQELSEAMAEVAGNGAEFTLKLRHLERFRPGRPNPTHRLTEVER